MAPEEGDDPVCTTWQPHLIRDCADGAFESTRERAYPNLQIRIEADGYIPVTSDWIEKDDATWIVMAKLVRDRGIAGRVLTPQGHPAAGATLAIGLANGTIRLDGRSIPDAAKPLPEKLSDRWRRPQIVKADEDGRFTLPTETDPAAMLCVTHESGYLERPFSQLLAESDERRGELPLAVSAWGHIAGEVIWKDRPGANEPIHLSIMRGNLYPELIASFRQTESDADGRFEFAEVPPGHMQLARTIRVGESSYSLSHAHVEVRPSEPTPAVIGGRGVAVVGKLAGLDSFTGATVRIQPRAPHIDFPGDDPIWKGYNAFRESAIGPLYFRDAVPVSDDGTFRIEDVLPGDYQMFVSNEDKSVYFVHSMRVPAEDPTATVAKPFDMGRIEVANQIRKWWPAGSLPKWRHW